MGRCFASRDYGRDGRSQEPKILRSCTIITCEPNEVSGQIHNRMPAILPEEYFQGWLSGEFCKEVLVPYPPGLMSAYPIGLTVNSPANNDAGILGASHRGDQQRQFSD